MFSLETAISLSFSLSLFTHTHTHTHTQEFACIHFFNKCYIHVSLQPDLHHNINQSPSFLNQCPFYTFTLSITRYNTLPLKHTLFYSRTNNKNCFSQSWKERKKLKANNLLQKQQTSFHTILSGLQTADSKN